MKSAEAAAAAKRKGGARLGEFPGFISEGAKREPLRVRRFAFVRIIAVGFGFFFFFPQFSHEFAHDDDDAEKCARAEVCLKGRIRASGGNEKPSSAHPGNPSKFQRHYKA